ncbi:hypothetical protein [Donghicola eburneus]|nr:hypothetical protein [Donghicola eburneus]
MADVCTLGVVENKNIESHFYIESYRVEWSAFVFGLELEMFSSNLSEQEILLRIYEFRKKVRAGISDKECLDAVTGIFGDVYSFPTKTGVYPVGQHFMRARPIGDNETQIPYSTIKTVHDAWEPPRDRVCYQGRLNSIGESLLYCCPNDPILAIQEARAEETKQVALMVYRSTRPINVATIGGYRASRLPKDKLTEMFYLFLEEEFGRDVPKGQEQIYSITRNIAQTFFCHPEQDAYCYRSVQSSEKFNVAFLSGRAKSCLDLRGVLICDNQASTDKELNVRFVVSFLNSGEAVYHRVGSIAQKALFPEIG